MKVLLKDKMIILSTTDCDTDFILIVNKKDYSQTAKIIEETKAKYANMESYSDLEMYSDIVCAALYEANIDFTMPDFEEL